MISGYEPPQLLKSYLTELGLQVIPPVSKEVQRS